MHIDPYGHHKGDGEGKQIHEWQKKKEEPKLQGKNKQEVKDRFEEKKNEVRTTAINTFKMFK